MPVFPCRLTMTRCQVVHADVILAIKGTGPKSWCLSMFHYRLKSRKAVYEDIYTVKNKFSTGKLYYNRV